MRTALRTALTAALLAAAGCGEPQLAAMPDLRLPTLSSKTGPSLASCPVTRCLTVYLAPWCHYCRQATPVLLEMRRYLASHGVETRVVIGLDQPQPIEEYARVFGPETLLDLNESMRVSGVPHFYVTNPAGRILKEVSGLPYGPRTAQELAGAFGLP